MTCVLYSKSNLTFDQPRYPYLDKVNICLTYVGYIRLFFCLILVARDAFDFHFMY